MHRVVRSTFDERRVLGEEFHRKVYWVFRLLAEAGAYKQTTAKAYACQRPAYLEVALKKQLAMLRELLIGLH